MFGLSPSHSLRFSIQGTYGEVYYYRSTIFDSLEDVTPPAAKCSLHTRIEHSKVRTNFLLMRHSGIP
jgi:hypothetical protein